MLGTCWEHVGNMGTCPLVCQVQLFSPPDLTRGPPDLARSQRTAPAEHCSGDGLRPAPPRSPAAVLRCLQVTVAFLGMADGRILADGNDMPMICLHDMHTVLLEELSSTRESA